MEAIKTLSDSMEDGRRWMRISRSGTVCAYLISVHITKMQYYISSRWFHRNMAICLDLLHPIARRWLRVRGCLSTCLGNERRYVSSAAFIQITSSFPSMSRNPVRARLQRKFRVNCPSPGLTGPGPELSDTPCGEVGWSDNKARSLIKSASAPSRLAFRFRI